MDAVTLGRTGLTTGKNGFGALPIQRIGTADAERILRKAFDGGIHFFDTARAYSDSEEKMGRALSDVRNKLIIATKTGAPDAKGFWEHLGQSLTLLKTDYIDLYQFHNISPYPRPGDGSGLYEAALEAKRKGTIRFIGLTAHRLQTAREAVESGLYDTLQFPFSYLSSEEEIALTALCREKGVGFIAMKSLAGGLITNAKAAYAFMSEQDNVLPIWGIQRERELDEFLAFAENPPKLDDSLRAEIDADRAMLTGGFCRGCGYCLPCPAGIPIHTCARMSLLIRRSPPAQHLTESSRAMMGRIENCTHCGHCSAHCPYGLDTPALLARNYEDYKEILAGKDL
ncbi:MAG: aldo/keto reductase [Oscillospiraceae bacterium]|jgi:aryl-alcohol dehydrogenase-like predicted oxidoreductase|nr:aldo/keto reductase [Oscillospiraceae bacterium]